MRISIKLLPVAFLLLSLHAVAQSDEDTLRTDEITITKDYQPKISTSFKLSENPKLLDTNIRTVDTITYDVMDKRANTTFEVEEIRPAKLRGEPLNKLYRAYAKGGIGNNLNTVGKLVLNGTRSRKGDWGLLIDHNGSKGNVPDATKSSYSYNDARVYGRKFFYNKILSGNAFYGFDQMHRYGFDTTLFSEPTLTDSLNDAAIRQQYQTFGGDVRLKSYFKDSTDLNFDASLAYKYLMEAYGSKEQHVVGELSLHRYLKEHFLRLDIGFDHNDLTVSGFNPNPQSQNSIVSFVPSVTTAGEKYKVRLGLNATVEAAATSNFYIYPSIYAKYNLVKDIIIPYAGAEGGLQRTNLASLSAKNPFIVSNPLLKNHNERYLLYIGVRGEFNSKSSFNLRAAQRAIHDYGFFVNSNDSLTGFPVGNTFGLMYDNIRITNVSAEASYELIDKLSIFGRLDYYSYILNTALSPWHLPEVKGTLSARYDIKDKLVLTSDLFFVGDRTALSYDPAQGQNLGFGEYAVTLPAYFDANIGIEYRYTSRLSAFLDVNNILNSNYQNWNQYRVQGFHVLFGFTYKFWGK